MRVSYAEGRAAYSSSASGRAPRGTLSRSAIVERATKVMDQDGVDRVTIRGLAKDLGVRPMALYTYFRSKDEILVAVYDELLSTLDLPESPNAGIDGVRLVVRAYFNVLVEHSELLRVNFSSEVVATSDVRVSEALFALLLGAGIDRDEAIAVAATLLRFAVGSATLYPSRHQKEQDADYWTRLKSSLRSLPRERFPVLHSFSADLPELTQEQVFEFGLDLILRKFDA